MERLYCYRTTEIRRRRVLWKAPDIAWDVCTSLTEMAGATIAVLMKEIIKKISSLDCIRD